MEGRRVLEQLGMADQRSDQPVEMQVHSTDAFVLARVAAIIGLALLTFWFDVDSGSARLGLALFGLAAAQPLLAMLWPRPDSFRQALIFSDIVAFAIFVSVAPGSFWLCVIVIAAGLSSHAAKAPTRWYAVTAAAALVTMSTFGAQLDIERWEQGVLVVAVLAVAHGYTGHRSRSVTGAARDDLLFAIGEAGGLAHLTDLSAGVVDVVGDVERMVGWSRDAWLAMDHSELIHPDDLDEFWGDPTQLEDGMLVDRTARVRTASGGWIWLRDISRVVMHDDRLHLRGFCIDVTAEQDGFVRASAEATTDALTGLRNRRWLISELALRTTADGHHLVLIDLNRFKDVNDSLGHEAGDDLLEIVSERLVACLRPNDIIARLGGDEFAILVEAGPDSAAVAAMVDRFAFEVARPVEVSGVGLTISLSAGIAVAGPGESDASTLLRHADIAMYAAKQAGLSSKLFDAEMEERSDRRAALTAGLAGALDDADLRLYFQPIVHVDSGRTVAVEGLARWSHADFGLLRPDSFLDVTLMSDSSGTFTRTMVQHAIDAVMGFNDAGVRMPVAVNIPVKVLEDLEFGTWVVEACGEAGVDPGLLVFEVAEQDIHETASIAKAIDRLVEIGITISVDDFGAGHATFDRLRWRNVEQLKLDRSVVKHAIDDPRERAILRSVLTLAADLGYDVVAEGVENEEQLELLRQLGCPLAQGYLFAAAMPLDDIIHRVVERSSMRH